MAETKVAAPPINIDQLNAQDLRILYSSVAEEVRELGESFRKLREAHAEFSTCKASVAKILKGKDKSFAKTEPEALVPLTNTLYVHGKLACSDKVIVDIGTGYFAEKSHEDAIKYYTEKAEYVAESLSRLQEIVIAKQNMMKVIEAKLTTRTEK